MKNNSHFAEVIESSLIGWIGHSWDWNTFPEFGSLLVVESDEIIRFGIVHRVQTGSSDPTRMPFPYQKTEEELLRDQPQIFTFLKTTFHCLSVGYKESDTFLYLLPPTPCKMHAFIRPASQQEKALFFARPLYLPLLFNLQQEIFNMDELLLAILKNGMQNQKMVTDFIAMYTVLTGNDYRRTKLLLERAQHSLFGLTCF